MSFCSSEKPPGKVMKNLFNLWICVKWCHCGSITRLYRQRAGGERLLHHRCDADSGMTSWLQMASSLLLPVCPNAHHKSDTFDRICAVIHFCLLRRTVEVCVCAVFTSWLWLAERLLFTDMDASYGGGLFDMVKGGAGKFFSNFKDNLKDTLMDTSNKVMNQVAT